DILSEEKARHESAQAQHEQIEHLRMHIESLRAEKSSFQQRQQALFQKQRVAEQDRNRLLGALQDDRSTVNQMRSERIRLCEERTSLEREVALLAREALVDRAAVPSGEPADPRRWPTSSRVGSPSPAVMAQRSTHSLAGAAGGVRGDVPRDLGSSPSPAFSSASAAPWVSAPEAASLAEESQRPHWTSFDKGGGKAEGLPTFGMSQLASGAGW
ncbi:unnamed protein product, partial [Polarella glacialis]